MKKGSLWKVVLAQAICIAAAMVQSSDAKMEAMNIAQMVEAAETIMDGTCTGVNYKKTDQGTMVTIYTLHVHHVYKGKAGEIASIKMFGGQSQMIVARPAGIPALRKEERYVLFLYPPGDQGLTSPVGWGQGTFRVQPGPSQQRTVVNALNNRNLLKGVPWKEVEDKLCPANRFKLTLARSQNKGLLDMDLFVDLIRALLSQMPRKDFMTNTPDTSGEFSSRSR